MPCPSLTDVFVAPRSSQLSSDLSRNIPGGVDSPFRSFHEVGGHTLFFERGRGSRLYDVDGNVFIDLLGAWGPAILGYCHPEVVSACQQAIANGAVFGAPHEYELELSNLVIKAFDGIEMVRFVNSGTEAVMSAVRLARGFTGRDRIVMFEGCYHGHSDSVLASQQHSASAGIPSGCSAKTTLLPYNNIEALEKCFQDDPQGIAAVLIEPVAGSMGVIPPSRDYLRAVVDLCTDFGALSIFDEVLTGLRLARGGAQEHFQVIADITCLGKALGGGMPIGAYGARREVMSHLQPLGKVYQAGTFSGNPVTMAGGIATLKLLADPRHYQHMEQMAARLFRGLLQEIESRAWPVQLQGVGSMFSILFSDTPVRDFRDSLAIDTRRYAAFFHQLLHRGVYAAPSAVDALAISAVHTAADIDEIVDAACSSLSVVFSKQDASTP